MGRGDHRGMVYVRLLFVLFYGEPPFTPGGLGRIIIRKAKTNPSVFAFSLFPFYFALLYLYPVAGMYLLRVAGDDDGRGAFFYIDNDCFADDFS